MFDILYYWSVCSLTGFCYFLKINFSMVKCYYSFLYGCHSLVTFSLVTIVIIHSDVIITSYNIEIGTFSKQFVTFSYHDVTVLNNFFQGRDIVISSGLRCHQIVEAFLVDVNPSLTLVTLCVDVMQNFTCLV